VETAEEKYEEKKEFALSRRASNARRRAAAAVTSARRRASGELGGGFAPVRSWPHGARAVVLRFVAAAVSPERRHASLYLPPVSARSPGPFPNWVGLWRTQSQQRY
jgi:hypothetical protein